METVDVYARPTEPMAVFVDELGKVLGLVMQPDEDGFQFGNAEVVGWVCEHDLVRDGDLDFPAFPVDVAFRARSAEFQGARDRLARRVFESLKSTRRYPLMLVFDDQTKLDEFRPTQAAAQSAA